MEGNTRNSVIASFQQRKGSHYIPSTVHNSIKWTTHNPWLESENISLDACLAQLEETKQKRSKEKPASTKIGKFGLTVAKIGLGDGSTQKTTSIPCGLPRFPSTTAALKPDSVTVGRGVAELVIGKRSAQKRRRLSGLPRLPSATSTHISNRKKTTESADVPI